MKSYFQYVKEKKQERQKKVDSMKHIERLDYLNRVDRIEQRFSKNVCGAFAYALAIFGFVIFLFSILLASLQTEISMELYSHIMNSSLLIVSLGIFFLWLSLIEYFITHHLMDKKLAELNKKYNL